MVHGVMRGKVQLTGSDHGAQLPHQLQCTTQHRKSGGHRASRAGGSWKQIAPVPTCCIIPKMHASVLLLEPHHLIAHMLDGPAATWQDEGKCCASFASYKKPLCWAALRKVCRWAQG